MKKILFMLFVILGISLQNVIAQNDSVVLPDYMYKSTFPRSGNQYGLRIETKFEYIQSLGKKGLVAYYTINNKKPVKVNFNIIHTNECPNTKMMVDNRFIIGSYCINDNECIIFTKYLKFYKFIYSDSSLVEFNDISQSPLFVDNLKICVNKALDEVKLFEKENPGYNIIGTQNGCLDTYCIVRGLEITDVGRMDSGFLIKIDSMWFSYFEYTDFTKNENIRVLLKSNDLKNWTKCKVVLNYKYKMYNEGLKSFVPFLFTFEDYDISLKSCCKVGNNIYFSDCDRLIYKSSDGGNTFKLYKIFRPFPEPVVPTFENTNH